MVDMKTPRQTEIVDCLKCKSPELNAALADILKTHTIADLLAAIGDACDATADVSGDRRGARELREAAEHCRTAGRIGAAGDDMTRRLHGVDVAMVFEVHADMAHEVS